MTEILNPGRTCGTCGHFVPPRWDPIWGCCMAPCHAGDPPDPEYPESPDAETCASYVEAEWKWDEDETEVTP